MAKKKIVLCDSNILFDFFQGNETVVEQLQKIGADCLAISVISVAEMYQGMRKNEARQTKEILNLFHIIHLDEHISKKFVELKSEHKSEIHIADALIAATALEYNIELFTLNVKDFNIVKGLKLYKPK